MRKLNETRCCNIFGYFQDTKVDIPNIHNGRVLEGREFGRICLSGAAACLGVCSCAVGRFDGHDSSGHLAQFAGGYDESGEVTTQ